MCARISVIKGQIFYTSLHFNSITLGDLPRNLTNGEMLQALSYLLKSQDFLAHDEEFFLAVDLPIVFVYRNSMIQLDGIFTAIFISQLYNKTQIDGSWKFFYCRMEYFWGSKCCV